MVLGSSWFLIDEPVTIHVQTGECNEDPTQIVKPGTAARMRVVMERPKVICCLSPLATALRA